MHTSYLQHEELIPLLRFRFDMMGKRVYKQYEKLSNIILRVSDGTRVGKQHALLLNSHVDSTVPSPGPVFPVFNSTRSESNA